MNCHNVFTWIYSNSSRDGKYESKLCKLPRKQYQNSTNNKTVLTDLKHDLVWAVLKLLLKIYVRK